jgi:hypothetical protein
MQTPITFVLSIVAHKHTRQGVGFKLISSIGAKIRIAKAPKSSKKIIRWWLLMEKKIWGGHVERW